MSEESERPRWEAHLVTYGTTQAAGEEPRLLCRKHDVVVYPDGRWEITITHPGHPTPTRLSGDGAMPALVEADGALIVILPPGARLGSLPTIAPAQPA